MAPPSKKAYYQTHGFNVTPTLKPDDWKALQIVMNIDGAENVTKKNMFQTRTYIKVPNIKRFINMAQEFLLTNGYTIWVQWKEDEIRWNGIAGNKDEVVDGPVSVHTHQYPIVCNQPPKTINKVNLHESL